MSPKITFGEQCEQNVISKLIKIIQVALQCSGEQSSEESPFNQTLLTSHDLQFAGKLLLKLVNENNTFLDMREDSFNQAQNGTKIVTFKPQSHAEAGRSPHRLQHLEMIKVGVLIFVVSIIMLTTCRMVFQLFVRYRPEKPQMH